VNITKSESDAAKDSDTSDAESIVNAGASEFHTSDTRDSESIVDARYSDNSDLRDAESIQVVSDVFIRDSYISDTSDAETVVTVSDVTVRRSSLEKDRASFRSADQDQPSLPPGKFS
jgi:hypothetical protein